MHCRKQGGHGLWRVLGSVFLFTLRTSLIPLKQRFVTPLPPPDLGNGLHQLDVKQITPRWFYLSVLMPEMATMPITLLLLGVMDLPFEREPLASRCRLLHSNVNHLK